MHRVGHAAPARAVGSDRRSLSIDIRTIHLAKALEVLHRNDGADLAAVAGQDDPFSTRGNVGKNVRKALTHG